jgi:ankyrin repeat protein
MKAVVVLVAAATLFGCGPSQRTTPATTDIQTAASQSLSSDPNEPFLFSNGAFATERARARAGYCSAMGVRTYKGDRPTSLNLTQALQKRNRQAARRELAADVAAPANLGSTEEQWVIRTRKSLELTAASARGDVASARELLESGADPNFAVDDGETMGPMAWAALCDNVEILDMLIADGGHVDQVFAFEFGEYPLFTTSLGLAVLVSSEWSVRALLNAGANPNSFDHWADTRRNERTSETPLLMMSTHRVVEALLDAGADPNLSSRGGWTPLMNAAERNDPEKIRLLLQFGADPNLRNNMGDTAIDMARRNPTKESLLALTGPFPKRRYPSAWVRAAND